MARRKNKENSEFKIKCGFFEINLKNAPKLALVIISVGICFLLFLFGLWIYKSGEYNNKMAMIESEMVEGKPLSEADLEFFDELPEPERDKINKNVALKIRDAHGTEMEQNVAPGTEVRVKTTKDGTVEIRKGGQPPGE